MTLHFSKLKTQFLSDERGQIAIMIGIFIIPIIAAIGLSVDYGRSYRAKQMTVNATDAAMLAVGRLSFNTPLSVKQKVAFDTFKANIPPSLVSAQNISMVTGSDLPQDVPLGNFVLSLNISSDNNEISISSIGAVKNYFMPVVDVMDSGKFDKSIIRNTSILKRNIRDLELVIALDVSGSMDFSAGGGSGTRIEAARDAISDFNDIIFPSDASQIKDGQTKVGIVPWNFNVQLPTDVVMGDVNFISEVDGENRGPYPRRFACTPSELSNSPKYWQRTYTDSSNKKRYDRWWDFADIPANLASATLKEGEEIERKVIYANNGLDKDGGRTHNACPSDVPLDLNDSKDEINLFVDELSPGGGTDANSGMYWARKMLDPDNEIWNAERSDFGSDDARKVIVIMSDGANFPFGAHKENSPYNLSSSLKEWVDYTNSTDETYGGLVLSQAQSLVATKIEFLSHDRYPDSMNGRFLQQCEAAKANDIIIYTIGFGLSDTTEADRHASKMLEFCAGTKGNDVETYSFSAVTSDDLKQVFARIAGGINSLQLSQ